MTQTYNKLVRDKIPEIINGKGGTATTRVLDEEEFIEALEEKLREEVIEYVDQPSVEELADILEVVYALGELQGLKPREIEDVRKTKAETRGSFKERIFLETVEE